MTKKEEKSEKKPTGLDLMRKKFDENQISKLPKQAKWMTDAKDEYTNCAVCGGYHHPKASHLDYVGHAALTNRLLDCDPNWTWEPMAYLENGAPAIDSNGGLWIKLTVCGMTRIGYGHPDGKKGGDANKEAIGDALRNAAMRFGAALDLWHKGDLHALEEDDGNKSSAVKPAQQKPAPKPKDPMQEKAQSIASQLKACECIDTLNYVWEGFGEDLGKIKAASTKAYGALEDIYKKRVAFFAQAPVDENDNIPY